MPTLTNFPTHPAPAPPPPILPREIALPSCLLLGHRWPRPTNVAASCQLAAESPQAGSLWPRFLSASHGSSERTRPDWAMTTVAANSAEFSVFGGSVAVRFGTERRHHSHLARPRMSRDLGVDRRRRLACQRKEGVEGGDLGEVERAPDCGQAGSQRPDAARLQRSRDARLPHLV